MVEAPEMARSVPLVYAPYQHNPHKHWAESRSKNLPSGVSFSRPYLKIYPHGFCLTKAAPLENEQPEHLKDNPRGEIQGFSNKSASRLREFMMTHHVEGYYPYAVTLTTQEVYDPQQWESIVKRFRTSLARKHEDWAACWRVELQKRKTPHLHCVFWLPQCAPAHVWKIQLTQLWIKATKEDTSAVWEFSVHVRDLTGSSAWMIYCTLHDSKHKKDQLGWKGRQWGIWNRKAWHKREPLTEGEFSREQRIVFIRRLRMWSRGRYAGKRVKPLRLNCDRNLPAFAMDSAILKQLLRGIV